MKPDLLAKVATASPANTNGAPKAPARRDIDLDSMAGRLAQACAASLSGGDGRGVSS